MRKKAITHEPGPWVSFWRTDDDNRADCGVYHERHKGHAYSICRAPQYQTQEQWEADAALICAAPDLLELAREFNRCVAYYIDIDRASGDEEGARLKTLTQNRILAMIAKAEGRTP